MPAFAKNLAREFGRMGQQRAVETVRECLENGRDGKPGGLKAEEFSVRDLACHLVDNGREWVESLDPRNDEQIVLEAGGAVDTTAFSNITGQIVYSKILEAYQNEAFVFSSLIPNVPTRFNGEKIPGVARLGDKAEQVNEGMPYPNYGFGEEYIETPITTKHGFIVPVTREAIFFDRTNLVLSRASEVGEFLGLHKEKRLTDIAVGAVNNYSRNGTASDTYQTATPWINDHQNELVDWTDIDNSEQLFADMVDPNTGEPIIVGAMDMVVSPKYQNAALRVLGATEIRFGDTSSATGTQTLAVNPVAGRYKINVSRLMKARIVSELSETAADAAKWWLLADFKKAFAYMENWPITVVQAPQNSEAEFTQDVVLRYKASERGAAAVLDPRFSVRSKH